MGPSFERGSNPFQPEPNPAHWNWNAALFTGRAAQGPAYSFSLEHFHKSNPVDFGTAAEIGKLFKSQYGSAYRIPAMRDPKKLMQEVASGKSDIFVIRDGSRVIAHGAVADFGERSLMLCRHLVDYKYQGYGLSSIIKRESLKMVEGKFRAGEVDVAIIQGVTSHPITQANYLKEGFLPTGIFDRRYTDYFAAGYRESVVRLDKILNLQLKNERTVFAPSILQPVLEHVYALQGCKRNVLIAANSTSKNSNKNDLGSHVNDSERVGFQAVTLTLGAGRSAPKIIQDLISCSSPDIKHLSVRVNASEPSAIDQINLLRSRGFFFAAVEVRHDRDWLVMQKPLEGAVAPYFHHVKHAHGADAQELMKKILKT